MKHLTGSARVVDLLNRLGHSVSPSTVQALETALAQLQINQHGLIPAACHEGMHSIVVWDNIDYSEETITGEGTSHHTNGILIQHAPCRETTLVPHEPVNRRDRSLATVSTPILPYDRQARTGPTLAHGTDLPHAIKMDEAYNRQHISSSNEVYRLMKLYDVNQSLPGWTGYNTLIHRNDNLVKSIVAYLPVIQASPTQMDTVFTILKKTIDIANSLKKSEIVLVFDLAIYAKAQEIRWLDLSLNERLVVRLGEFHQSMSFLSVIGKRFRDAGLLDIFIESGIVAHGSANAVVEGRHYNRSLRCHKIMSEALGRHRFQAFLESITEEMQISVKKIVTNLVDSFPSRLFDQCLDSLELSEVMEKYYSFIKLESEVSKTFAFWSSYIDIVDQLLQLIHATRTSDWEKHLQVTRSMMCWYFAYDHLNYARYLPAYWVEMTNLHRTHPLTHEEFMAGKWTVQQQTKYGFSATACDQVIEQTLNRDSKTSGGVRGFTRNENAVKRWVLSQPQRSAIARQCESMAGIRDDVSNTRKDLEPATGKKNEIAVQSVIECITQMVNPFASVHVELVNISSGIVASPTCTKSLMEAEQVGEHAAKQFMADRLQSDTVPFHAPMKKLKLETFSTKQKSGVTMKNKKQYRNDHALFARLIIMGRKCNVDLRRLLSHSLGNVSYPLASTDGNLAKTNKSALFHHLLLQYDHVVEEDPVHGCLIIDAMALIQSLPLGALPRTFGQLAHLLLDIVLARARRNNHERVDMVFDTYPPVSIKCLEHKKRASAIGESQVRKIYGPDQALPKQWKNFLLSDKNKNQLVEFMFQQWSQTPPTTLSSTVLVIGHGSNCHQIHVTNGATTISHVPELECDHEEADTRMILHAAHGSRLHDTIVINSPDTDVLVLALSHLSGIPCRKMVLITGGKESRAIDITKLGNAIGWRLCAALIAIHNFTGCDTTSAFHGKGKTRPFNIAANTPVYIEAFGRVGRTFSPNVTDPVQGVLEQFVCQLYGQQGSSVNEAMKLLITQM